VGSPPNRRQKHSQAHGREDSTQVYETRASKQQDSGEAFSAFHLSAIKYSSSFPSPKPCSSSTASSVSGPSEGPQAFQHEEVVHAGF